MQQGYGDIDSATENYRVESQIIKKLGGIYHATTLPHEMFSNTI